MIVLSESEKQILRDHYDYTDPEAILSGPSNEAKNQLINLIKILREDPGDQRVKIRPFGNSDIAKLESLALDKAENEGIHALSAEERRYYELYLLGHINKINAKGESVKPIHANIADLVLCEDRVISLNQELYIYDYETGTYRLDPEGREIKRRIRAYLDRNFREDKIINGIYNLIVSDSRIAISAERINNRPKRWIHFLNGYYDYKTGEILPHNPDYYEIGVIPWEYLPSRYPGNYKFTKRGAGLLSETIEEGLIFDSWIEEAIPDSEDRAMLLQYIAYAMTLDTSAQKFLLICGPGGTGKSTILKLIEEILGKYNLSSVSLQGLQDRFAPAGLFLKQGNICADIPLTALSEVDMIKKLTGEDTISADRKFKNAFTFRSYARLFFSANDIPYIGEKTNAFYRRMLILKMDHKPYKIDPDLYNKLRAEIPNIITKIVEEYWCSEGDIVPSDNCLQAVKNARKESDTVEAFLDDRCEIDPDARTSRNELYRYYCNYCDNEGRKYLSPNGFYKAMEMQGFQQIKSKTRDIIGVKISNIVSLNRDVG